jgi:hypothetical protein
MATRKGPLESKIKAAIMKELEKVPGLVVRKRHGTVFGKTGDPDLYGSYHGQHFELEVKRPGEKCTPLQTQRLAEWAKGGALTGVVNGVNDALAALGFMRSRKLFERIQRTQG